MSVRVALRIVKPQGWTGGVNYLLNICRVLHAHEPDVEPVLFGPPGMDAALNKTIVEAIGRPAIELADRAHADDARAVLGLDEAASTRAFRDAKIDVVFESTGYYGRRPKLPMLAWIPDFQHRRLPHFFTRSQWLIREMRYRSLLANRGHILLSSNDAQADMVHLYGSTKATIHVVPFAICMNRPATYADGERVRLAHGLPERFIFMPNQFWPHKNHRLVVEALGRLAPGERPCIAASGLVNDNRPPGLMQGLRDGLAAHGAADNFRFLGHLPYADILALNARTDALLNPSLFEGWSTPVEEAKALGTPMALSSLGVHREQVGEAAIFFDPHDADACAAALRAVMAGPPRAAETIEAVTARNQAAQKRFAAQLRTAIEATLADHRR